MSTPAILTNPDKRRRFQAAIGQRFALCMRALAAGVTLCIGVAATAAPAVPRPTQLAGSAGPVCRAGGSDRRTPVVELYTSEGCSSCPPADRWLSALAASGLGDQVLALAMHVDYWDRLGWPDRFADRRFTDRQRALAQAGRLRSIYTPQVVIDGQDVRRWWDGERVVDALRVQQVMPAVLRLRIEARRGAGAVRLISSADPVSDEPLPPAWRLITGLTQDGLASTVARGENAGRELRHDRVVRAWLERARPGVGEHDDRFALDGETGTGTLHAFAMAVDGRGRPLQAAFCTLPAPGPR
ncbi:MAG: DUF1223 domain-containing protein [Burkholderiaceae bacterium]